ncbi:MAG: hypothetical protein JNM61_11970 [Zoogloeaceae bacterium]|nr:hypothetical protein [Zoogloeaceae bacterium]
MKARAWITALSLVLGTGALTGCVVYPARPYASVGVESDIVVRPTPYYAPWFWGDYRYYDRGDWHPHRHRDGGRRW